MEAVVCPSETHSSPFHPLVLSSSLASVYCHEYLVWFEDSVFYYITTNRLSLEILLDTLLLSFVFEILQFWICRFISSPRSNSSQMSQMLGLINLGQPYFWAWWYLGWSAHQFSPTIITWVPPSLPLLAHPPHPAARSGASSPNLRSSSPAHLFSNHQGQLHCLAQVNFSAFSPDCCE